MRKGGANSLDSVPYKNTNLHADDIHENMHMAFSQYLLFACKNWWEIDQS